MANIINWNFNGLEREAGKGLEFMLDYNLIDVYGLVKLDEKFDMVGKQRGRADVSLSPIQDGIQASKLHDHSKLTLYQDKYLFDTKYYGGKKLDGEEYKEGFVCVRKRGKNGGYYWVRERKPITGKAQIGEKYTITLRDLEKAGEGRGKKYENLFDVHKVGGFVPIPLERGVYKNVAVIDFEKYYPNMFKSTNAGILTAIDVITEYEDYIDGWGINVLKSGKISKVKPRIRKNWYKKDLVETPIGYFRKDIVSLNTIIFDMWLRERLKAQARLKEYQREFKTTKSDKWKQLWTEQFNIKNFMNAYFGVSGLPIDRGYNKLVFNSCTISCQDVIMMCINALKKYGYTVIGGDTDSCFVSLKTKDLHSQIAEGKRICNVLNIIIDNYLSEVYNIHVNTIDIGLETISDKFFVDVKKHYIKRNIYVDGTILDKPEIEIKGMDLKKRSNSVVSANAQQSIINGIFYAKEPIDDIKKYICEEDSNLVNKPWSYLCKRAALNKPVHSYPDSNESGRAARNAIKFLNTQFNVGDNPMLAVCNQYPNEVNEHFVEAIKGQVKILFFPEQEEKLRKLGFKLDIDNIREQLYKKTDHFLSIFGEDWYSLVEASDEAELDDWFLI